MRDWRTGPMTELRRRMLQDMEMKGLAEKTQQIYVECISLLARFFKRSPELLGQKDLRGWVRHLMDRGLSSQRLRQHFAALRLLYGKTLGRPQDVAFVSWPRDVQKLPDVLSADEVEQFLAALERPIYRVFCTLLYATGLRLGEALALETRGHVEVCRACRACGHEHFAYHSCRNRHCPKCEALAQERWIRKRTEGLLPVRHFHVVVTLPAPLRALCRHAPRQMYEALLAAASASLIELAMSRWRALPGVTAILHTWTRDLRLHPHVHLLVTAGGLHLWENRWVHRPRFLLLLDMLSSVVRGKMLQAVRRLRKQGVFDSFADFADPEAFERLLSKVAGQKWLTYTKEPFRRAEHVLRYLGRYTHRVAVSNSRLLAVSPTAVTFRTRGSETATLPPVEFLHRFVQHVLPPKFHKIRHHGLYASASSKTRRLTALNLLRPPAPEATAPLAAPDAPKAPSWQEELKAITGRDVRRCPRCGSPMVRHELARAPPPAA